jgi:hypothetical protein
MLRRAIDRRLWQRLHEKLLARDPFDDPHVGNSALILGDARKHADEWGDESPVPRAKLDKALASYLDRRPHRIATLLDAYGEPRQGWAILEDVLGTREAAEVAVSRAREAGVLAQWDALLTEYPGGRRHPLRVDVPAED